MIMLTSEIVKAYGIKAGANVVGIAASKDFTSAPDGAKPNDVLPECRSVIVLAAAMPKEILSNTIDYTASRNAKIKEMTAMAKTVEKRITKDGHKAKAISAIGGKSIEVDGKKNFHGHISLKHAAELAGLGVIGKNYLLTNPIYGNLLWFSAVLTDADLTPNEKLDYQFCGNCNLCVEACPVGSLDNPASFGRNECRKFFKTVNGKLEIQCYRCRTICPHGSMLLDSIKS
jgi:epoxyqueuosine reductase QueG